MKTYKFLSLFVLLLTIGTHSIQAKAIDVTSPNGDIKVVVDVKDKIYYSIYYGNDLLLKDCYLNMQLEKETLGEAPKLKGIKRGVIDESIKREIPLKNAIVRNHCNTLRMNFADNYAVEFRVFDNEIGRAHV